MESMMLHIIVILAFLGSGMSLAFAQAPSDGRLKQIVESKSIKIAYRSDAAPFSYLKDQKDPAGYTIDLCMGVVASIEKQFGVSGMRVDWVPVTTQTRFEAIADGRADIECGSSTVTLGRMKQVDFSNIIFVESTAVVVGANSGIGSATQLAGKRISVISETTNERALKNLQQRGLLNATLIAVKDREEGIAELEAGKVDAFASDRLLLFGAKIKNPSALTLLSDELSIEPYGITLPRGDWELRLAVNTGLSQIFRSNQGAEIFNKWFGPIGLRPGVLLSAAFQFGAMAD